MVSLSEHDVFVWFRQLPSYRRLETLCQILNVCVPLEVRFVQNYLTKLATREQLFLKEHEVRANNPIDVQRLAEHGGGPLDMSSRSRLIVSLALLRCESTPVATILYNVLANGLPQDKASLALEPKCLEELVLLYAMSALHPAFTYTQQISLERLKSSLEKLTPPSQIVAPQLAANVNSKGPTSNGPATNGPPVPAGTTQPVGVGVNVGVGVQCPPGQPVYTYPLPVISSLIPPQFQWCHPPPNVSVNVNTVQMQPVVQPGAPPGFSPTGPPTPSQQSTAKLNQVVVVKAGNSIHPQKVSLCGTFADGRQMHVVKDYAQIAELRNKLSSSSNSLPPLSTMYNNNTEAVHKEIRELFDEICAHFADLDIVSNFFDRHHPTTKPGSAPPTHATVQGSHSGCPTGQTPQNATPAPLHHQLGPARFMTAQPPPLFTTNQSHHRDTSNVPDGTVYQVLRTNGMNKYIPKFHDVASMNDFCELTPDSLKARGLSTVAIQRVQRIQALNLNGSVGGGEAATNASVVSPTATASAPQQQRLCAPPIGTVITGAQTGGAASSEEESTSPSSSPSPPSHQPPFNTHTPPPHYYGAAIVMQPTIVQQGGASCTTYLPTTAYPGYHIPTFVATAPPQQNGVGYVSSQGVQAVTSNGQQMVHHPMLVHTQHGGHSVHHHSSTGHAGGHGPQQLLNGCVSHNGQIHSVTVGGLTVATSLAPPPSTPYGPLLPPSGTPTVVTKANESNLQHTITSTPTQQQLPSGVVTVTHGGKFFSSSPAAAPPSLNPLSSTVAVASAGAVTPTVSTASDGHSNHSTTAAQQPAQQQVQQAQQKTTPQQSSQPAVQQQTQPPTAPPQQLQQPQQAAAPAVM